jgi:hypothetical protein
MVLTMAAVAVLSGACAAGPTPVRNLRPVVVSSGARIQPDSLRIDSINHWVPLMQEFIWTDPSFMIITEAVPRPAYPWETIEFIGEDSVRIAHEAVRDPELAYQVYAFLHLMRRQERIDQWFPEAAELEGYDLERFILDRTADTWLLGRTYYDTQPYEPLDELIYTQDRGYLDEFILVARPDEFPDARDAYEEEHPGQFEEYESWFRETFERDPPGSG